MSIGTVPCYRKECSADAGYKIQLMCGEVREVCFEHLHDFILERGSVAALPEHVAGYRLWRTKMELPELSPEDALRLVRIARNESGYRFTDWEY